MTVTLPQIPCNYKMDLKKKPDLVCVIGHTAGGKTAFAAALAEKTGAEIISADSRQVYRRMDLGTGKDFQDYVVNGKKILHHLIDIVDPGYEYNVFEFQKDFLKAYNEIKNRNHLAVMCGGTGMYIEAVLKAYKLINVPPDPELRKSLDSMTREQLIEKLSSYRNLHNTTDTENRKRLLRAIEIEEYYNKHELAETVFPKLKYVLLGIKYDRESRRNRITQRLKERLSAGMVEETEDLLKSGIPENKLIYYGLEYKYLTLYIQGELSYEEMFNKLNTAIHQFAKRQMTWFRKMEREGFKIHWMDGHEPMDRKLERSLDIINNFRY